MTPMIPEPKIIVFPRTLPKSEMELIQKEFVNDSPISRVLKALAEKGPQSQYAIKDSLRSRSYGTAHDVVEELERAELIKFMREETTSKGTKRKIYALNFPYGLEAAIAYVQQEDLDMEAVQESNSTLIQELEEDKRDYTCSLIDAFMCRRDYTVPYCQHILLTNPGDDCEYAYLEVEGPPPYVLDIDTGPSGVTTYSSVLVKHHVMRRLDKARLPRKGQSRR